MSVLITYSPHHSLRHSSRHLWRSLWKRFLKPDSKRTNSDLRYVYEHVKTVLSYRDRGIRMFVQVASEAPAQCVNAV